MTILQLQIVTTLTVILWFDVFGLHRIILGWFGKKPWEELKPFSCYFCTSFWLGIGYAIGALSCMKTMGSIDWETLAFFIMLNTIISRILDSVLGYDTMKGK